MSTRQGGFASVVMPSIGCSSINISRGSTALPSTETYLKRPLIKGTNVFTTDRANFVFRSACCTKVRPMCYNENMCCENVCYNENMCNENVHNNSENVCDENVCHDDEMKTCVALKPCVTTKTCVTMTC